MRNVYRSNYIGTYFILNACIGKCGRITFCISRLPSRQYCKKTALGKDKIDNRKRDKCRPVVADQTSSETVNPHVKHHVCALLYTAMSPVDIALDRSVLSSYTTETFRAGGWSRVFNAIQRLLRAKHEGTIHVRRNVFKSLSSSWYQIPRMRERRRRGCDSISECEHRGFLIAVKGLDKFPLRLYFLPL